MLSPSSVSRSRSLWLKNRQSFVAAVTDPNGKWHKGAMPLEFAVEHDVVLRGTEFDTVVDRSCLECASNSLPLVSVAPRETKCFALILLDCYRRC